jgi:two-component system, OmpR family, phosphate regulon sensor histidine kinase PhoR
MKKSGNILFILIVIYILAAGGWWSYLLHSKNKEVRDAQLEKLQFALKQDENVNIANTEEFKLINSRFERQRWMIIGEGSVFMLILLFGLWRIYRIRQKELALALQQQNFLLSITHELKSPLASVQLILETIQKRQLSQEQLQKLSSNGLNENDRLHRLVQDLLLAARVEGGYEYAFEELNLNELLKECIAWAAPKFKGKIIFEEIEKHAILNNADRNTLSTAFSNLIENALKYASETDEIILKIENRKNQLCVDISDKGPGIPKNERDKIFNKFYRIGNEDTRKSKGTGLGLYIVKKVIEAHKGTIIVKDNQPKGTVFSVMFLGV